MSRAFTKLFSSITESTVWGEPYPTRILWVAMLAMADRNGCVSASVPGLARRAGITMEECETALTAFLSPDQYSRTKDHEGRRVEEIDGGWRLLNYLKYREMRDEDAKREADANRQRRRRSSAAIERGDSGAQPVATSSECHGESVTKRDSHAKSHEVAQAEAEAEAEKKENKTPVPPTDPEGFAEAWAIYPKREGGNGRKDAAKTFEARLRAGVSPDELVAGATRYRAYCDAASKTGTCYVKQAATFFGPGEHWREEWTLPSASPPRAPSRLQTPPPGTDYGRM